VSKITAKQREQLAASRERVTLAEQWHVTARTIAKYLFWLGVAYFAGQAVSVLAGKRTYADISVALRILGEGHKADVILSLTTAFASVWAVLERTLRKRNIKRTGPKLAALQASIDSKRTSSSLTETGDTNPIDR